jgi:transcriptional regulator with XRE-family HTH domain
VTAPTQPRRRKDFGVGAWLGRLREEAGLTQAEVAQRMAVSPAAIWKLEHGRMDPRMSTVLRYGDAIGARIHIRLNDQAHTDTTSKETA